MTLIAVTLYVAFCVLAHYYMVRLTMMLEITDNVDVFMAIVIGLFVALMPLFLPLYACLANSDGTWKDALKFDMNGFKKGSLTARVYMAGNYDMRGKYYG